MGGWIGQAGGLAGFSSIVQGYAVNSPPVDGGGVYLIGTRLVNGFMETTDCMIHTYIFNSDAA